MANNTKKGPVAISSYSNTTPSTKQYKLWLATAKTHEEKRAIKNFYLSEPVKYFGKQKDLEEVED